MPLMPLFLVLQAAPSAAAPPPEVIQLGDGKLGCEELVAQVNVLSHDLTARQHAMAARVVTRTFAAERAEDTAKTATGLLAGAVPMGLGGIVGDAADHAAEAARDAAVHKSVVSAMDEMPAMQAVQQRIDHLEKLAIAKQC